MDNSLPTKRRGRPPKNASDNVDTRSALIRSGIEVLTEQGFASAGLDGILKRVGVPKGSFYYYFSSKEAFGYAILEHYGAYFAKKLDRHLLNDTLPPLLRIRAFVADAKQGIKLHDFQRGCLVGNLGQEVNGLPQGYRVCLQATLTDWQYRIAVCLREAQRSGDILSSADCVRLAEAFWIGWEGAVMRARLEAQTSPLDTFLDIFLDGIST